VSSKEMAVEQKITGAPLPLVSFAPVIHRANLWFHSRFRLRIKKKGNLAMQPNHLQASSTLLTHSLVTTPMPVQVSPSAINPSLAKLTFVISCPRSTGKATVAQIIIALPVDEKGKPADPTNLAESTHLQDGGTLLTR
jgi:hypothetical protein